MSDVDAAVPVEDPAPRRAPSVAVAVAVIAAGLALGGAAAWVLTGGDDEPAPAEPTAPEGRATDRLLQALLAAGVPDVVAPCAAATVADEPAEVQAALLEAPLQEGGPGREAVAACALEHLATSLEADAGIAGTDARCVAGGVLDRVRLELVLASIGALAVTEEVAAAATAAAEACAA